MAVLLAGRFRVIRELGSGSFGSVYQCVDAESGGEVALKVEPLNARVPQLMGECEVYAQLAGGAGVAEVLWSGSDAKHNFLAMELLGASLEALSAPARPLGMKTVLMVVEQTLAQVPYLHLRGFVHRDIKPANLLVGCGRARGVVHLIDFGASRRYRDAATGRHIEIAGNRPLVGTVRYASVAAMQGTEQSRRDDREALGYAWPALLRGALPWQDLAADRRAGAERVLRMKMALAPDGLPEEFAAYFRAVARLRFNDEPDYAALRAMFRALFVREGFVYDYAYDWAGDARPPSPGRVSKHASCLLPRLGPHMRGSASSGTIGHVSRDPALPEAWKAPPPHAATLARKRIALPRMLHAKPGA
jgi:serine/threonine protein kinase